MLFDGRGEFLFAESIDIDTYDRHKDKLRQGLTLLQIDQHADQLEKFDAEGILAFAERVLPRALDLWVQASLAQRQRLFFPDGVVFDGKGFVRTGVSTHALKYLICLSETIWRSRYRTVGTAAERRLWNLWNLWNLLEPMSTEFS